MCPLHEPAVSLRCISETFSSGLQWVTNQGTNQRQSSGISKAVWESHTIEHAAAVRSDHPEQGLASPSLKGQVTKIVAFHTRGSLLALDDMQMMGVAIPTKLLMDTQI